MTICVPCPCGNDHKFNQPTTMVVSQPGGTGLRPQEYRGL